MVANRQHKGRTSRRNRRGSADINITPFVDVMLVLLIVFMVSAPLMITGQTIDLPDAKASIVTTQLQPVVVTIDKNGGIYLEDKKTDVNTLKNTLTAIYQRTPDTSIYVQGDTNTNYGGVMQVVGEIQSIGFRKFSFITESN